MTVFEERLAALETKVAAIEASLKAPKKQVGEVADASDLDGQYGDPTIKYGLKEKYWPSQPDTFIGARFSQCTPEYLDATAKYLSACAYMARKDGDEKKAGYKDKDAARARGWAKRLRDGWGPKAEPPHQYSQVRDAEYENAADSDLPF